MELDVDPEDPEVLVMTCLVSTDHNTDHNTNHNTDDNTDDDNLDNPKLFNMVSAIKFSSWRVLSRWCYMVVISQRHIRPGPIQ